MEEGLYLLGSHLYKQVRHGYDSIHVCSPDWSGYCTTVVYSHPKGKMIVAQHHSKLSPTGLRLLLIRNVELPVNARFNFCCNYATWILSIL